MRYSVGRKAPGGGRLSYKGVPKDKDGFADAEKFLPMDFDLCILRTLGRTVTGWWTGQNWEGLKITKKTHVVSWKKGD